jgi:hypothetical protein
MTAATEADPDAIGPDGTVRLRCYLPSADSVWLSAGCDGLAGCGHSAPIGIRAAIRLMGSGETTAGQLERRLRCSRCGNRQVSIVLQPDTRPPAVWESEGPRPETRAGLPLGTVLISQSLSIGRLAQAGQEIHRRVWQSAANQLVLRYRPYSRRSTKSGQNQTHGTQGRRSAWLVSERASEECGAFTGMG